MITVCVGEAKDIHTCDVFIVPLTEAMSKKGIIEEDILHTLGASWQSVSSIYRFKGKKGQNFMYVGARGDTLVPIAFVGLGSLSGTAGENLETVRAAFGTAYTMLKKTRKKSIAVCMPRAKSIGVSAYDVTYHTTILFHLAAYSFTALKPSVREGIWEPTIILIEAHKDAKNAVKEGNIVGEATVFTRTLADMPGNHMTPSILADKAEVMAKKYGLTCTIFGEDKAKKLGMGCYLSVSRGSDEDGKFVVLEYAPAGKKDVPTIALVGKGVCFDTGGISLKPANYMTGMKYDMSGAAAVLGSMQALAQLKPQVRVIGVTPLVENMPSGHACKQDDVVTAMNGKTVEIENTDAEGRLILADALCYVQKNYKPETIIDIATLTGACAHALGHFYSGIMTRNKKLRDTLSDLGELVGDKLWPLPMSDEYKPALKSYVADVANCGTPVYKAGATTAALFLEHFIENGCRWAHLDIAGTDNKIPNTTYLGKGATGVGVRLFVEFAMHYKG